MSKEEDSSKYILIEGENGEFVSYPTLLLRQEGGDLVLVPLLKHRAEEILNNMPRVWRKNQILEEISATKYLPGEELSEIKEGFRKEFNDLKSKTQNVLREIKAQMKIYVQLFRKLNSVSIYLEIEQGIGVLDGVSFNSIKDSLRKEIEHVELKRRDLKDFQRKNINAIFCETNSSQMGSVTKKVNPSEIGGERVGCNIEDLSKFKFRRIRVAGVGGI